MPQIGDRVLVEASYNGAMPFKWNATRVQVIAPPQQQQLQQPQKFQTVTMISSLGKLCEFLKKKQETHFRYVDAKQPPRDWSIRSRPQEISSGNYRESSDRCTPKIREILNSNGNQRSRDRRVSRSPSRSPSRKRSRSPASSRSPPPARRRRNVPRYSVQIPKVSLDW